MIGSSLSPEMPRPRARSGKPSILLQHLEIRPAAEIVEDEQLVHVRPRPRR